MEKMQILVVDDESLVAKDIQNTLEGFGYNVPITVSSGEAAIQKAEENNPDLVLMDIVLKGRMDGIEAAHEIRTRFNIPVVYLTAYTDEERLQKAKLTEPFGYIVKPFRERELKSTIEMAIYNAKIEREIKQANKEWSRTFDAISDLIFIQNADYTILRVNRAFASALKARPEDLVGKKCYELLHKRNSPWPDCPFEQVKKDKTTHIQEIDDVNIGMPLMVTASPIFNDKGDLIGCVHVAADITIIKEKGKELAKKMRELERFNKAAVGRELKMEELKARIRELEKELGK